MAIAERVRAVVFVDDTQSDGGDQAAAAVLARTISSAGIVSRILRVAADLDLAQQQLEAAATHLGVVLPDGRERRTEELPLGKTVEADDADVLRHPAPGLEQRVYHAQGHLVVGRENRGDVSPQAKRRPSS